MALAISRRLCIGIIGVISMIMVNVYPHDRGCEEVGDKRLL